MKYLIWITTILLLHINLVGQVLKPNIIGCLGTEADSSGYNMNFTVGEVVVGSGASTNFLVTHGFQQGDLKQAFDLANCETPDDLPCYNIEEIPPQTVYSGIPMSFYVWSHELGFEAERSIEFLAPTPNGEVKFSDETGKFTFNASDIDRGRYTIIFRAVLASDTVWQETYFDVVPFLAPEQTAFGLEPGRSLPRADSDEFMVLTQTTGAVESFNHEDRQTYNISIAGKQLIFDKDLDNKLRFLVEGSPRKDVKELSIYAEELIIRSPLHLPQTNVTIHARRLLFEDKEEFAFINTQPIDVPLGNQALNGLPAGNLTLHLQDFRANVGKRFRLNGGNTNALGDGGNGGIFDCNLDLQLYAEYGGSKTGVSAGQRGTFETIEKDFSWLHPYALKFVVAHAKAAYLNGYMNFPQNLFNDYDRLLEDYRNSTEWTLIEEIDQLELDQLQQEMGTVLYRLVSNLDYFGNPAGWVPMLSFEVNKLAFEQEIDNAIRVLYFTYWMDRVGSSATEKTAALQASKSEQEEQLQNFRSIYSETKQLLPQLEAEAAGISAEMDSIQTNLERLEQELIDKAKYVVEERHKPPRRSWWRKTLEVVGSVAKLVPIYQPALGAIGEGLQTISNINVDDPIEALKTGYDAYKTISAADFSASADNFSNVVDAIEDIDLTDPAALKGYYKNISEVAKPIYNTVQEFNKKVGETKVPMEEIQAELEKLKAESPEFTAVVDRAKELMFEKAEFEQKITNTLQKITSLSSDIQAGVLAIDGMNVQLFDVNSKRDLRAMLYAKDMEARAKERLMKYHYYMAKAYEYRLLKPYRNELNISDLFDRFKDIIEAGGTTILTLDEFEQISAIYDEALATVTANILETYNQDASELEAPLNFELEIEDLAALNSGQAVHFNMVERGMFLPETENIRIADFEITDVEMHFEGGEPNTFAYFDLVMQHSGISRLKKDGEVYLFNHYNNENRNPITWSASYDAKYEMLEYTRPSPSVTSLLKSLLEGLDRFSDENLTLYSRPAAWADIVINKTDVTDNGVKMVLDRVQCRVTYHFQRLSTDYVSLEVRTNGELEPYIEVSESDVNERQDGWGDFSRSYFKNPSSRLSVKAPITYGTWEFENWTDFFGNVVSTENEIQVDLAANRMLQANYIQIQPVLFVPKDTIYLNPIGGIEDVAVQNIGSGDMNWTIESDVSWLGFVSENTGLNNDSVQIFYAPNVFDTVRTTNLVAIAPTSLKYRDTVVLVQTQLSNRVQNMNEDIFSLFPNPTNENITVVTNSSANQKSIAFITDVRGNIVHTEQLYLVEGYNQFDFDTSTLPTGVYFLRFENSTLVHRFLKL